MITKDKKIDLINQVINLPPPRIDLNEYNSVHDFKRLISEAIKGYTDRALIEILDNMYTEEDLENDLGLK